MNDIFLGTFRSRTVRSMVGATSAFSAYQLMLEVAVMQGPDVGTAVHVEVTSNRVDQFGGYTEMRPTDFRDLVHEIADRQRPLRDHVVLRGDHLRPNARRAPRSNEAMDMADVLLDAHTAASITKIHLDCCMSCASDPSPLTHEFVTDRAARLVRADRAIAANPTSRRRFAS